MPILLLSGTLSEKKLARYYDQTYKILDYLKEMPNSWKLLKLRFNSKKDHILKKYFGLDNNTLREQRINSIRTI